jgi:hypothetical protein
MASDAQNTLYEIFAGLSPYAGGSVGGGMAGAAVKAASGSESGAGQAKSGGSTAGAIVKDVLKSGFGLVSLVTSLAGLFGGDEENTPPPLIKYALPTARDFEAAETPTGFAGVDYNQAGAPRAIGPNQAGAPLAMGPNQTGTTPAQVNVTVQAMDARSFLDRSTEIAAAVREAMLNLNSINDVVNDL